MIALSVGIMVESFDFGLYGFSATAIASTFFPAGNDKLALLGTFAVFAVSFLARPLGGLVLGRLGDHAGRRSALSASIVVMGMATIAIGLIPGYGSIGVAAPVLLVVCRLVQGFAASGEVAGATTYIAEAAPAHRRGFWTNVVAAFPSFGTAAGTVLVLVFKINPDTYAGGGWRWPFIIGGLIAVGGLYLRLRLKEPEVFQEVQAERPKNRLRLRTMFREHYRGMLLLVTFYALVGIGFQTVAGYMPTFMSKVGGIGSVTALVISIFAFLAFGSTLMVIGHLSDRYGRKPFIIGGTLGLAVVTVPAYLMISGGNLVWICVAQALLILPLAVTQAGGNIGNLEVFPASVRFTSFAFSYAVAYAIFAGTAPLIEDLLTETAGPLGPAFYGVLIAVIALAVLAKAYPESRSFSIKTGRPEADD
ncbi:MFS transporter [Amycolatopsis rhabdoformis]|uniref:MFS transporter n=1 Tax=Amycolatopsis rhabdoformis TaxID=1448059 RepID=A0ABZ1IKY4_9PSEU|nr:MFS transporter [Amycolatopsis rhabdoformis]WSE34526.1 MFS transporter [Amycolatopsis rhabdoformis]